MKKIVICLIILVLICIPFAVKKKSNKVQYKTDIIKARTIVESVEASGTINPVNTVAIGSQVSGQIEKIFVDYNSKVKKGQLLAQIDTSLFEAQLQKSEADINSAKASLAKIRAQYDYDEKTYARYKNLYARNLVSKNDLESKEASYKSDLAQINAAKASISQAEANLKTARANMRYTKITSPIDGTVISKSVEEGQTVASSFQTPTLFTLAEDLTKMRIETSVSEADIGRVKHGQEVSYTLDGYPGSIFKGEVSQVRLSPVTESNVVTYTVIIDASNEDGRLLPGMTANVSIITNKAENVLTVPNGALKFTIADNKRKYEHKGIWIDKKGKPERINIETGASDDSFTQIISDNIKAGDKVYTGKIINGKGKNNKQMRVPRM